MRLPSLPVSLFLVVHLLAGCATRVEGPAPALAAVDPTLICLEQLETTLTLTGTALSPVAIDAATDHPRLLLPAISLTRVTDASGVTVSDEPVVIPDDPASPQTSRVTWLSDTSMRFEVYPELGLLAGVYDVSVANANGETATLGAALTSVPRPTLASAEPDLFCTADGARGFTLTGTGFLAIGLTLPTVTIGGEAVEVESVEGCVTLPGPGEVKSCTTAHLNVPAGALTSGSHQVVLTNPAPAACASTDALTVAIVAPPAVSSLDPPSACVLTPPAQMTATGTGFLVLRTEPPVLPVVQVDGATQTVLDAGGCTPVAGTLLAAESCTWVTFTLPALAAGEHSLSIFNPDPAGCAVAVEAAFTVAPAPVLAGVTPLQVCSTGGSFTVSADPSTVFVAGATVKLRPTGGDAFTAVGSAWVDATHVTGSFLDLPAGFYDVTVDNGAACEAAPLVNVLELVSAPFVYFADPPVLYDGIDLTLTLHYAGGTGEVQSVVAIPSGGGTQVPLAITDEKPGKVQVLVPAGALAAGSYDFVVSDALCAGTLAEGVSVTSTLTVAVADISPPFGWTGERIPVAITATQPLPEGMVGFAATPRVYLSPRTAGGVATEIRAITFLDAHRLSGTIPAGMPVDRYDLVVVNPDGSVGVRVDAFEVLAEPPPVVSLLAPGSVPSQDNMTVSVLGASFDADATAQASCRWVDDLGVVGTASLAAEVTFVDPAALTTVWDFVTAGVPNGAVCVLRVTNVADGTWADFSALSVTPASNTPNDFDATPGLNVGRRALTGAALRMNAVERFVFAIGGDNGQAAAAFAEYASVESARVDPFGVLEPWALQRNALPAARTFTTAATVGRFVYLPGGKVAGAETRSVLRAYLLDPDEAPVVGGLDLAVHESVGLEAGLWVYRVAAVMDAADPANPGGESLASEPVNVRIPALPGARVQLTLLWTALPNATAYRVYRTPAAGAPAGQERLLAEVAAIPGTQRYTDDGATAVDPQGPAPLPLGSLGVWHPAGELVTARQGAAVVAVPDPNDPTLTYLEVFGGLSGGVALRSAERAIITASATSQSTQTLSAFTETADVLPVGRWQTAAVAVDHAQLEIMPATDAWIYVLPGFSAAGGEVSNVTAFKVDTKDGAGFDDGRLDPGVELESPRMGAGAYGAVARNGFLYILAGAGTADAAGKAAEICKSSSGGSCSGGAPEPPDLVMWNAGIQMTEGRVLNGTAAESGFVFVFGGQTETSVATSTCESTNI